MDRYTGAFCPVCKKAFQDKDDIVVCPDCGTPHHRACWFQNGLCANACHHGEGGDWKHPDEARVDGLKELRCPRCGMLNESDSIFCRVCGSRLETPASREAEEAEEPPLFQGPLPIAPNPYTTPYGGLSPEEEIDGVAVKDLALFIGDNSSYFLPRFKRFSQGKIADWNWSAFFFTYLYFFYRKMYGLGALLFFATLVLGLPSAVLYMIDYQEVLLSQKLIPEPLFAVPGMESLTGFATVAGLLLWTLRIGILVFSNRIYYQHAFHKIQEIREQCAENHELYLQLLPKRGRQNRTLILVLVGGYFALNTLSVFLLLLLSFLG